MLKNYCNNNNNKILKADNKTHQICTLEIIK